MADRQVGMMVGTDRLMADRHDGIIVEVMAGAERPMADRHDGMMVGEDRPMEDH